MAKKVIIDCDVGVDDALALILAFHSPELEVQAVTGVNGNVPLSMVFPNIQRVLTLLIPSYLPWIARGADRPLAGEGVYAHGVHGGDGLGGAKIADFGDREWWRLFPGPAHELICDLAAGDPDKITLIAVGPLTNLALALDHRPEAMKMLKEIIIMGGAVRTPGNITPFAEFNIFVDPLAAARVFSSGVPIRLVPLDATRQATLTPDIMRERIVPDRGEFARFVREATGFDAVAGKFFGGRKVFVLHDPLAVGAAILPDLLGTEEVVLEVVTGQGERRGQTRESLSKISGGGRIGVAFKVRVERFLELFISRLKG